MGDLLRGEGLFRIVVNLTELPMAEGNIDRDYHLHRTCKLKQDFKRPIARRFILGEGSFVVNLTDLPKEEGGLVNDDSPQTKTK